MPEIGASVDGSSDRDGPPVVATIQLVQPEVDVASTETPMSERAVFFGEAELSPWSLEGDVDHVASCGWPYDSPCVRCYPDLEV